MTPTVSAPSTVSTPSVPAVTMTTMTVPPIPRPAVNENRNQPQRRARLLILR